MVHFGEMRIVDWAVTCEDGRAAFRPRLEFAIALSAACKMIVMHLAYPPVKDRSHG
jgi:hypothetical protein